MNKTYNTCFYAEVDYAELERLSASVAGGRVIIYGFGMYGRQICDRHFPCGGVSVLCFADSDVSKAGERHRGIPVISPAELFSNHASETVIVSPYGLYDEIRGFLTENGVDAKNVVALPFKEIGIDVLAPDGYFDGGSASARGKSGNPLITVYSCFYNNPARLVRRAIQSILGQTFEDFTYRLLDNGSTGETADIIKEYARLDGRIEVIRYEDNIVPSSSEAFTRRQYGALAGATTEWLCHIDSDDYYEPTFMEETLKIALENKADLVKARTVCVNFEGNRIMDGPRGDADRTVTAKGEREIAALLLRDFGFVSLWGSLFKTEKLLDGDPRQFFLDYYLFLNCLKNSGCAVLCDKILHFHTIHDLSTSLRVWTNNKPEVAGYELTKASLVLEMLSSVGLRDGNEAFERHISSAFKALSETADGDLPGLRDDTARFFGLLKTAPGQSLLNEKPRFKRMKDGLTERLARCLGDGAAYRT
jgi:glycosyltransferase involved in cell wall biosynthesis